MEIFFRLPHTSIGEMKFKICRQLLPNLWLRSTALIPGIVSSSVALFKKSNYKKINKYFLRHLLGITKLDKENNQSIRVKTGAENIVKEIKQYQENWLQHIQSMDTNRIPK